MGVTTLKKLRSVPTDTDFAFYYKMLNVKSTVPIVFLSTVGSRYAGIDVITIVLYEMPI